MLNVPYDGGSKHECLNSVIQNRNDIVKVYHSFGFGCVVAPLFTKIDPSVF